MAHANASTLYRLEIVANDEDFDQVCGVLALNAPFGWEEESKECGKTRFIIHNDSEEYLDNLREKLLRASVNAMIAIERINKQDWLEAWRQFFTPVECGSRFVVLPPWLAVAGGFSGRCRIFIEPKSAFGTGHHATTALCLSVLSELLDRGRIMSGQSFLDLGTGSGILGLACAKSGLHGLGLDIDPLAIDNAQENRGLNHIASTALELGTGDIEIVKNRTFDLVLANILARPLMEMAANLSAVIVPAGCLMLSGILKSQADAVEAAYMEQGLPHAQRFMDGEWCALVWA